MNNQLAPYNSDKGFTLIELLLVIAIIAILVATVIPWLQEYRQRAVESSMVSDAKNSATAFEGIFSDAQTYVGMAIAGGGPGPSTATMTIAGFAPANVRISTNNTLTSANLAATAYQICVANPNARPTRLAVAIDQRGVQAWGATCAAAEAAVTAVP